MHVFCGGFKGKKNVIMKPSDFLIRAVFTLKDKKLGSYTH
jgi:hypothetical protein